MTFKLHDESIRPSLVNLFEKSGLDITALETLTVTDVYKIKGMGRRKMQRVYGPDWYKRVDRPRHPFAWTTSLRQTLCKVCDQIPTVAVWYKKKEPDDGYLRIYRKPAIKVGVYCDPCSQKVIAQLKADD